MSSSTTTTIPSCLDLFSTPPQLSGVLKTEDIAVKPIIFAKNSGQIVFNFSSLVLTFSIKV